MNEKKWWGGRKVLLPNKRQSFLAAKILAQHYFTTKAKFSWSQKISTELFHNKGRGKRKLTAKDWPSTIVTLNCSNSQSSTHLQHAPHHHHLHIRVRRSNWLMIINLWYTHLHARCLLKQLQEAEKRESFRYEQALSLTTCQARNENQNQHRCLQEGWSMNNKLVCQ